MKIDEKCFGKWMWRNGIFGKQEFKPMHIISGKNIMDEKVVGIDGGERIGFGYYYKIVMHSTDLNDWHFQFREDYCGWSEVKNKTCRWENTGEFYATECGGAFEISNGESLKKNCFKFCPYCGGEIKEDKGK